MASKRTLLLLLLSSAAAQDPGPPEPPPASPKARPQRGRPGAPPVDKPPSRPQGGKLDVRGFGERFTSKTWTLHPEHMAEGYITVFGKLDTNKDGYLEGAEMRELHKYLDTDQPEPARRGRDAGTPTSFVSDRKKKQTAAEMAGTEPLDLQKFREKYQPLLDRLQVSEGGKPYAKIFAELDQNGNHVIDGDELTDLSTKVSGALKTPRPTPDGPRQPLKKAPEGARGGKTDKRNSWQPPKKHGSIPQTAYDKTNPLPPHDLDRLQATQKGEQSPMQFEKIAKQSAKELGKSTMSLFKELDVDDSGGLSTEELKAFKSLLFTGKSHTERSGERKWPDHASRDPRKAPASQGKGEAGGKDLTFAEFEELYKDQVTSAKQPHGHHKAFLALDRNEDNVIQPHELNALQRWIRSHPDL